MTTRQDIQVAWDMVRKVNLINDWLVTIPPIAEGKEKVDIFAGDGIHIIGQRDMTIEERKTAVDKLCISIERLRDQLDRFLADPEKFIIAQNGLNAWGVDFQQLKDEKEELYSQSVYIRAETTKATKDADLNKVGKWVENNTPKLYLLRKS